MNKDVKMKRKKEKMRMDKHEVKEKNWWKMMSKDVPMIRKKNKHWWKLIKMWIWKERKDENE